MPLCTKWNSQENYPTGYGFELCFTFNFIHSSFRLLITYSFSRGSRSSSHQANSTLTLTHTLSFSIYHCHPLSLSVSLSPSSSFSPSISVSFVFSLNKSRENINRYHICARRYVDNFIQIWKKIESLEPKLQLNTNQKTQNFALQVVPFQFRLIQFFYFAIEIL